VVGVLSYLRARGIWGPYLVVVSQPGSVSSWAADLQQLLSDSVLVHTHDGSQASREAVTQICQYPRASVQPQGPSGVWACRCGCGGVGVGVGVGVGMDVVGVVCVFGWVGGTFLPLPELASFLPSNSSLDLRVVKDSILFLPPNPSLGLSVVKDSIQI